MLPALPDEPAGERVWVSADEVGEFRQGSQLSHPTTSPRDLAGTPVSRWALARYLVGRAIAESVGGSLLVVAVVLLGLAAGCYWALHWVFFAVLLAGVALLVLVLRAALRAVLRRLTAADRYGPIEARLRAIVRDTRGDVRRELRRIGLPSHTATLPLLAARLAGRRRAETVRRLRSFRVDRVVPQARLDELHLLLQRMAGRG